MATYLSYRNGGKTDEEGLFKWFSRLFTTGFPTNHASTSMQAVQRGSGANMSVDISIGDTSLPDTSGSGYNLYGWNDAVANQAIATADPTNPRIDVVYTYVDLSVVQSTTSNNPAALKFGAFAGTPAGSPTVPSDSTIQAALGAGVPFVKIAQIAVAANASNIVNANITDLRAPMAVKSRLWGGASNTIGHVVPNVADDTVALLNATQAFTNKTFTSAAFPSPAITLWDSWQAQSVAPNTVVYNGNHSYALTYNGIDLTGVSSNGYRSKYTRTVAAPTKCTSLNGSSQYFNNASPAGMTYTNNFVVSAWVKLGSYNGAASTIASRYNGTSGFSLQLTSSGQVNVVGWNSSSGNYSQVISYQSIPLNKWVHVAGQLDMATFTATPTTSYTMIDGVDVPAFVNRGGTNPTALIQAGNLEIGSQNGGTLLFPGKIAQVAIYNAKITQANIAATVSQGLVGTETALVSAYSFNSSTNDLNANANNLTPQGAATATNADAPFTQQSSGIPNGTTDYGIQQSATYAGGNTTIVVQVPEGNTLATSGGISAVSYSGVKAPYGFPAQTSKWTVASVVKAQTSQATAVAGTYYNIASQQLFIPVGEWKFGKQTSAMIGATSDTNLAVTLSTANNSESNTSLTSSHRLGTSGLMATQHYTNNPLSLSSATTYYLNFVQFGGSSVTIYNLNLGECLVFAENAYL